MQEIVDFLASQAPFDALDRAELDRLARVVKVAYFPGGAEIDLGDGAEPLLWVIRRGQVEILDYDQIIDLLGTGDTFGYRVTAGSMPVKLRARAVDDTIGYRLPDPSLVLEEPDALRFAPPQTLTGKQRLRDTSLLSAAQQTVERHMRPVIWCEPDETVRSAAARMTRADSSFVLVRLPHCTGIATDRDFRSKVATGTAALDSPIAQVAVGPVESVNHRASISSALIRMVEAGVHHLVVTDDTGIPVGVVRAIDLGPVDVRDPLLIRRTIDAATDLAGLSQAADMLNPTVLEMHANDVPPLRIAEFQTAIVESIVRRLLTFNVASREPTVAVSWMVLGSLARREPLPGSDVDTAILWDADPGEDIAERMRARAADVLDQMERCGLRRCPDGANADNPLFSRSRVSWIASARRWVADPTLDGALLLSSIIADSRPISSPSTGRAIVDTLRETTQGLSFRHSMLQFATATEPPVGFVRDFVVERSGRHRGGLDLKGGGLRPIIALARWLALVTGDVNGGTLHRIRRAGDSGLLTSGEGETLSHAFEDVFSLAFHREVEGLRAGRAPSTWITPDELDVLTRRQLRESFRAVATIQTTVLNTWRSRLRS